MESEYRMKPVSLGGTIGADLAEAVRSGKRRRIYIATSWKNENAVRKIAALLRIKGHQVFDFTDPENRVPGIDNFVFRASEWPGKKLEEIDWLEFLEYEPTKRAFKVDKSGLDWADTVLMMLPCGRNAHLEAGYGVGRGKELFIYGSLPKGEYEAMYGFAEGCYRTQDLKLLLDRLLLTRLQAERSDRPI